MNYSFCRWTSCAVPRSFPVLTGLLCFALSFAAAQTLAQQLPSNVYRPPNDNFNQRQPVQTFQNGQQITYPQQGFIQPRQNFQPAPQYQTVPGSQQFIYPSQNQTPVYGQPIQTVPGQVLPQATPAPAQKNSENVELKSSLVKARDLMKKYQLKLEDVSRRNQELENEIATLQQSGDMSDSNASQELVAAKAAAAKAQEEMSGLDNKLQTALRDLQSSQGDLDRQKQMGVELKQQIVSLEKSAQMAAGSDQQVAELTRNIQQVRTQNSELNVKLDSLQKELREKETQIASMGSSDDSQLADLKELLGESETTNKDLSEKLRFAEAEAAKMSAPQMDPVADQLRADNKQLETQNSQLQSENGQLQSKNVQLQSENGQLNDMLIKVKAQNSQLDATVTNLQNMPAPAVEASGFAAAPSVAPSADLTALQQQLASAGRKNKLLERKIKLAKSDYASLTDENARLTADLDSSIDVAPAPVLPVKADVAALPVAVPELGLNSVSGGWPVKYWIFSMLGVGLFVGLGVAWYESVVDPKGLRRSSGNASNH